MAHDAALRGTLARWLMAADYGVELAEGPKRARAIVEEDRIGLAIVEADRTDAASVDFVRELGSVVGRLAILADGPGEVEQWAAIPVRVDASILKPLEEQQVLARVNAVLSSQAASSAPSAPERLMFEELTLDVSGRACRGAAGAEISLTRAEFFLLRELARHPGKVLSRGELSLAAAGRDAEPDDRSVDMLVSRLRRKVERDAKAPRIIVTVPGGGYKFMATPQSASSGAQTASDASSASDRVSVASPLVVAPLAARGRPATIAASSTRWMLPLAATLAASLIAVGLFWHFGAATNQASGPVTRKFDPTVVPLVNDATRKDLEIYLTQPDFKALAISTEGWGYAQGAADLESARREAIERCIARSPHKDCKTYAVGLNVVWPVPSPAQPVSADIRREQLDSPFSSVQDLRFISQRIRTKMTEAYPTQSEHQAFALKGDEGLVYWTTANKTPAEAARVTVERCSEFYQSPCLLIAVDNSMTVRIPKLHNPVGLFMLSTDRQVFGADKQRIAEVYEQKDWRALVRGRSGKWFPVANAPSEAAAVEAALKSCRESEQDCAVYAIGNFRVLGEQPPPASAGQPPWAPSYWTAIASDGKGRWTYSLGQTTQDEARNDTIHVCGANCKVDVVGQNRCLAYVESRSGGYWYGAALGGSERGVIEQAKNACQRGAPPGTCEVVKAYCG